MGFRRFCIALLCFVPFAGFAADPEISVVIKDHRFIPSEIRVPADKKLKLIIENQDATPEEFESYPLNREKIIPGRAKATVFIGPLKPGKYPFFGDFNQATARGEVIAE